MILDSEDKLLRRGNKIKSNLLNQSLRNAMGLIAPPPLESKSLPLKVRHLSTLTP